jgi:aminomethyltransferase
MGALLSPLDNMLKRSGAHMAEREGWVVAADFGSLPGEIAASRAAAGMADVSSIGKLEVRGPASVVAELHPSGKPTRPGHALEADDAWWCRVSPELLLVLGPPGDGARKPDGLIDRTGAGEARVTDVTSERVAVCLTGPRAGDVLVRAGATPTPVGGLRVESVAGVPTLVVRQHQQQWLLVASAAEAGGLWQALTEAGAPLGLAYVGADALQHLAAASR